MLRKSTSRETNEFDGVLEITKTVELDEKTELSQFTINATIRPDGLECESVEHPPKRCLKRGNIMSNIQYIKSKIYADGQTFQVSEV